MATQTTPKTDTAPAAKTADDAAPAPKARRARAGAKAAAKAQGTAPGKPAKKTPEESPAKPEIAAAPPKPAFIAPAAPAMPAKAAATAPAKSAPKAADAAAGDAESDVVTLNRQDLVNRLTEQTGVKKRFVKPVVEAMLLELGNALSSGAELNLQPLGKIKVQRTSEQPNAEVLVVKLRRNKTAVEAADRASAEDPLAEAAQ